MSLNAGLNLLGRLCCHVLHDSTERSHQGSIPLKGLFLLFSRVGVAGLDSLNRTWYGHHHSVLRRGSNGHSNGTAHGCWL